MDAVAITSIIAAAVVSLAVSVLTITADNRRQRRHARSERFKELRDVLDLAGAAITAALYAGDRRRVADSEQKRETTGTDFDKKVETVQEMESRIAIRLGDGEAASRSYREALERLQGLNDLVYEGGERMTPEQRQRADELRKEVVTLRGKYLKAARALVADSDA